MDIIFSLLRFDSLPTAGKITLFIVGPYLLRWCIRLYIFLQILWLIRGRPVIHVRQVKRPGGSTGWRVVKIRRRKIWKTLLEVVVLLYALEWLTFVATRI